MGLEPTSDLVATCFRDRFLIQPDDFRNRSAAEVGIEPTPRRSERPILPLDDPAVIVRVHQNCGGRNRTRVTAVNSRLPVPARVPPQSPSVRLAPVRTAGFEPAISRSPTWHDNQALPRSDQHRSISQQPVRESNPSRRLERAVSCTDRRTRRIVRACGTQSGPGGVRILVCGFSGHRRPPLRGGARISATSPLLCRDSSAKNRCAGNFVTDATTKPDALRHRVLRWGVPKA